MNPLSWKCQGLGNPQSIKALHDLVRRWDPKVVFLMETKSKTRRMERIKNRIGMANDLIVPCIGRSGGLALLWAREVDLEIKSFSKNHINATITKPSNNFKWRLTGFYGHSETHRRYESWHLLAFLHSQFQLLWLCLGDFNEILSAEENWVELLGPNSKWMASEKYWIIVVFKTWAILGLILLGATCKRGKTENT